MTTYMGVFAPPAGSPMLFKRIPPAGRLGTREVWLVLICCGMLAMAEAGVSAADELATAAGGEMMLATEICGGCWREVGRIQ